MEKYIKLLAQYINRGYELLCGVPKDKLLHVVVSATVTALLSHIVPFVGLLLIMTLIFIGKETYDKLSGKGSAEWKDIVADYVGFIIGVI